MTARLSEPLQFPTRDDPANLFEHRGQNLGRLLVAINPLPSTKGPRSRVVGNVAVATD